MKSEDHGTQGLAPEVEALRRENAALRAECQALRRVGDAAALEQRRAEAALRESEARYRDIVENQSEFTVRYAPGGVLTFLSPSLARFVGDASARLIGTSFYPLLHPDDREAVVRAVESLSPESPSRTLDERVVLPDGRFVWQRWTHSALFRADGSLVEYQATGRDVTQVKTAERRIDESERKFTGAFHAAPALMTINRYADGVFLEVNERFCEVSGFSREEIVGRSAMEVGWITDEDRRRIQKGLLADGRVRGLELLCRARDGSEVRTLYSCEAVDLEGEKRLLTLTEDVTERYLAEQRYQRLFREMIDGWALRELVCDADGVPVDCRFLAVNPAFEKLTGLAGDAVVGRTVRELFPGSEADLPWLQTYARVVRDDAPACFEYFEGVIGKHLAVTAFRSGPGQFASTLVDISDRVRAEEALQQSEARFRTVFDASPLGISVVRDGRQLFANEAYARLFRYPSAAAAQGTRLRDQLAPEALAEARRSFRERGGTAARAFETVGLRQDGTTFPFHVHSVEIQLPDGPATMGFLLDLSDRKRAEEERASLEAQLRQAQKMEAIGTLAGGIAHDFNNILTPVMAHAELALMQLEEGHPVRDDVVELVASAERARDLVRQILIVTRREADSPLAPVRLGSLVRDVARFLRASLPATIEIRADVDPDCGPVLGDLSQLHQVLLNLGTNAGYAMQEGGGVLTLFLERVPGGPEGSRLRMGVRDTGPGIPDAILGRIFEPYFTTKPVGKGSGLGLAVCHGIVARLGGEIRVRSAPGEGACFEVLLPETERREASQRGGAPAVPRGRGERVLLVDDEPAVRASVGRMLAALGYRGWRDRGNHGIHAAAVFVKDRMASELSVIAAQDRLQIMEELEGRQ
ncbi:MAG: PAS domain S-box protein [Deltaproteobacteria bacterium]|nr:PAS domain S-box protein [Deltaproteobacteria bacterium]